MEEAKGITINTNEERKVKSYGAKLSLEGIHDMRIYDNNTNSEIICTEDVSGIEINDREYQYIVNYLRFLKVLGQTKRTIPTTKKEAYGKVYTFCPPGFNYGKAVESLSKKGIMKEVMWRISSKQNTYGSLMAFVTLTPLGRKFLNEKVLSSQEQQTDTSSGSVSEDGESSHSNP